jgi:hypothetical protein
MKPELAFLQHPEIEMFIGVDPGPETHGVVVWNGQRVLSALNLSHHETIRFLKWHQKENSAVIAVEMIECFGMPVGKEIFKTVLNIGEIRYAVRPCRLIPRRDVKLFLCNSMRAKDGNVRQALIDLLGPKGTKAKPGPTFGLSAHTWSALAIAVTAEKNTTTINEWL